MTNGVYIQERRRGCPPRDPNRSAWGDSLTTCLVRVDFFQFAHSFARGHHESTPGRGTFRWKSMNVLAKRPFANPSGSASSSPSGSGGCRPDHQIDHPLTNEQAFGLSKVAKSGKQWQTVANSGR
eukprot:7687044-Pyramimonas_sp.AAC.1